METEQECSQVAGAVVKMEKVEDEKVEDVEKSSVPASNRDVNPTSVDPIQPTSITPPVSPTHTSFSRAPLRLTKKRGYRDIHDEASPEKSQQRASRVCDDVHNVKEPSWDLDEEEPSLMSIITSATFGSPAPDPFSVQRDSLFFPDSPIAAVPVADLYNFDIYSSPISFRPGKLKSLCSNKRSVLRIRELYLILLHST